MVGVEQWAEIRRMHFVGGVSIKEIARRTGRDRNTVRRALRAEGPPGYRRAPVVSKLEPFREEIHRLLKDDPKLSGVRVRESIEPLGYAGSKTIVDDYLREVRPLFSPRPRVFSADGLPAGPAVPVRSVGAERADRGRSRRAAPGVGDRRVFGLLAGGDGRVGVL